MVTEEKAGPKINDELASVVNDGLRKKAKQNKVDELTKKYAKPENVHSLTVPKINLGIWSQMSISNRMNDVKLQKIQNLLGKAACPMLYLMDMFLGKSQTNDGLTTEEVHSATQLCKDAYQMTQVTYADITFRRRALIQAEIQPKYKALCKDDVPGRNWAKPILMETHLQKEKVQKEVPRAGQEVLELPKQISLPVSTSVQQLNTQFTFSNTPDNFIGGKVKTFLDNWMSLTSDNWVLDVVKGYQIEFEQIPYQNKEPNLLQFDKDETNMVQLEIDKFLQKQIIKPVTYIKNQYVSNIFTRPKKDGTCRVILNLKVLNNDIEKHHFKMETLKSAIQCVSQNCWFASIDLKDAYYSISIDHKDRKYLRFYWNDQLYEYTCLPNGLTTAPRIFTKVLKVPFSHLRKIGHKNVAYIDDSLLISDSYSQCAINISDTVTLLDKLGFTIHPVKSVFEPTQTITFLGFVLNSITMTIKLTTEKAQAIKLTCCKYVKNRQMSIRQFAQIIGKLIAAEPGVEHALIYIKSLEIEKDKFLKQNNGDFDTKIIISNESVDVLNWWISHVESSFKPLVRKDPEIILKTETVQKLVGVVLSTIHNFKPRHGRKSYPKTDFGGSRNNLNSTFVEHSTLVPSNTASYCSGFLHNTQGKRTTVVDTANRSSKETSVEKTDFGCLQIVGQIVQNTGLSKKAAEIVISSWRQSTQKQYWTYLKKWCTFCCQRKIDIFTPTEVDVVEFLTVLYESGVGYSSINTARSALSSYLTLGKTLPIGQWPLVKRFLRGVYNKRPMFPRYQQTWDVNVVLEFLITLSPVKLLSLRCLTLKLVMLLALVTGQRIQRLHCVDLDFMKISKDNVIIEINEVLKTSKPGKHLSPICLPAFVDDTRLCIVTVLNAYIERTSAIRTSQKLFVTFVKPYHHPTKSTISNWIKLVLKLAGVNTSVFKNTQY
ncbi:Hypothetical predicted protein [Mytilus galloprovincialis]|uniref:Reverse transcriptase domain-containing protein n=1 Tax=Mytilus galloprovincialis TaxID=29158 RepID=A0A8B6ENB3_MYTGA|nr:Hypothetical predicted protein [Mytilus galloprovincialis]